MFIKRLKIYLAGTKDVWKDENYISAASKRRPNILESFYAIRKNESWYQTHKQFFNDFLLDSGAFTFMQGTDKQSNWVEYAKSYANYIKSNGITKYFELDIDSIVGLSKVEDLRKLIEDITGIPSIPVWHKSRGLDYWYKMTENYGYISIGGIVSGEIKRSQYKAFHKLLSIAHSKGTKVHGLGFTNIKGMKEYRFDSVDSITWLNGRFGIIYQFNGETLKYLSKGGDRLPLNKSKVDLHNFTEWTKLSNHLEAHF